MSISIEVLQEALKIKEHIASLEARLNEILGGGELPSPFSTAAPVRKRRKKMSATARAKISAAQKARWAKAKGTPTSPVVNPRKKKRGLSPVGRARIAAAQKARWAAQKK